MVAKVHESFDAGQFLTGSLTHFTVTHTAAVGAIYGAGKLGKYLSKGSYQTGRNLGSRYKPTSSTK